MIASAVMASVALVIFEPIVRRRQGVSLGMQLSAEHNDYLGHDASINVLVL